MNRDILVLEDRNGCTGKTKSEDERCVIELVRQDETIFVDQPRQVQAVGRETHPENDGFFGSDEFGNSFFKLK